MSESHSVYSAGKPFAATQALVSALLALTLYLVWYAASLLKQDLVFTAAETEVSFWGRGEYLAGEPARAEVGNQIRYLLNGSRAQPDYLTLAASYYAWQAYWAEETAEKGDYNLRALRSQYLAQQSRPAYRQGWTTMLGYGAQVEGGRELAALASQRLSALRGGTHELAR